MIFLHVGWMSWYRGLSGQPDKIVGGGSYVKERKTGGEICNFHVCDDGFVYGHVETSQGDRDRQIKLENFGGSPNAKYIDTDVVWTATDPKTGGRWVIGWYKEARIYRNRKKFGRSPSKQHRLDKLKEYRVRASAANVTLLNLEQRHLRLGKGKGWMGHTQWWAPSRVPTDEIRDFLEKLQALMTTHQEGGTLATDGPNADGVQTPGTSADGYRRYVSAYEIQVSPRHHELQSRFQAYLRRRGYADIKPNVSSVDLRFKSNDHGLVLAEVKPCDAETARYAIRYAIGQLLDYSQKCPDTHQKLIVVEVEPGEEDRNLALANDFGIAFPHGRSFGVLWPS